MNRWPVPETRTFHYEVTGKSKTRKFDFQNIKTSENSFENSFENKAYDKPAITVSTVALHLTLF